MNQTFTIGSTADALIGAGLVKLESNLQVSLMLVAIGIALKVALAFLKKNEVPVESNQG